MEELGVEYILRKLDCTCNHHVNTNKRVHSNNGVGVLVLLLPTLIYPALAASKLALSITNPYEFFWTKR